MSPPVEPTPQPSAPEVQNAQPVRACPVCGGEDRRLLWTIPQAQALLPGLFFVFRCRDCRLTYVSPRPDDATLVRLYDEHFYDTAKLRGKFSQRVYDLFLAQRRRRIERYVRGGRLLDVGCGDGRFARHMAAHGWDTVGFDFSPAARELAQQPRDRVQILEGQLADHRLPAHSFDVITLWQVLEHIPQPLPLLQHLRRLLKPSGLLVTAVPNIDSLQAKIAGERWWGLDVPRHLVHYAPGPLRRTLTAAGFSVSGINHALFQYSPYALFHSLLDYLFTRRHFLSDFAKRTLPTNLGAFEYGYNVAVLTIASPMLAPTCLLETIVSSRFARGGFIEAYATASG